MSFDEISSYKGVKKKMSITIDEKLLKEFNEFSKDKKINKSQTISNLIKIYMDNEKK